MTDFTASSPAATRAPAFNPLVAFRAWRDARMTERALSKLTDRELDDIGLSRCDIADIAYGASRRAA